MEMSLGSEVLKLKNYRFHMIKVFLLASFLLVLTRFTIASTLVVYISPQGDDKFTGEDKANPKQTIKSALEKIRLNSSNVDTSKVILLPGTYYLDNAIDITLNPGVLIIKSSVKGEAIIKGSKQLKGEWKQYQNGIMMLKTEFPISPYSQLYVNGIEQTLARYPNVDLNASHYKGYAADAIAPERVKGWADPEGAIIHAMHSGEWGGFHYKIESVDKKGKAVLIGGHQNNRPSPLHKEYRMVENVFEELDVPGEWYFDNASSMLYLYPLANTDLTTALVEISALDHLFELKGTEDAPLNNVSIQELRLEQTNRTFMQEYEPLLRSDWMIYRGAAIYMENAESCSVIDCEMTDLGGNAIFISGYNRSISIQGNHIHDCGASAVCFVGLSSAVRSPSFTYKEFVDFEDLDTKKGPKTKEYPSNCLVVNNLIHDIGKVEKQTAGVQISMAMDITVRHNTIYDIPRAGINVSEGTWGGHIVEFNDVFNTVLESSDHGAFNSWGRDRFWHPNRKKMDELMDDNPEMPYWDAIHTTIIRNNRMRCDHGWDIDLDDGSSNYHLYNNLCLNGGIKLREGFYRTVENNIMVNNGFHPHVWFKNSGDVFRRNIMMTDHKDIRLLGWGKEVNYNLFPDQVALEKAHSNGTDTNSAFGDPLFLDPENGDFTVDENSLAIQLGFINFTMDQFGVQKPELKKIAKTPEIPALVFPASSSQALKTVEWLGASLKNIETVEERSAAGLNETSGILITDLQNNGLCKLSGLMEGDVIVYCNNAKVHNITELLSCYQGNNWTGKLNLIIFRNQQELEMTLRTK